MAAKIELLVVDLAGAPEPLPERQLSLEHGDRAGREHDAPVVARLGDVLIHTRDAGLRHAQRPVPGVVVRNHERNLFGRPEPGEKPELVIVALRLTPIPMERGDEAFGFLDTERIGHRPVLLADLRALESRGGIALLGVV